MIVRRLIFVGAALLLGACDDSTAGGGLADTDVFGDAMPDDFPAGSCAETMGADCETEGDSAGMPGGTTTADAAADCVAIL